MRAVLATLAIAAALLGPSEASAWVCRAVGVGAAGVGHGPSAERAKYVALRRCEHGSILNVCTIQYCRR
ncbi:MAG: hypothetical protein QOG83_1380 [Alphaproteobacteria bacterium]|jgi:hypothetical protein|nr:hypothetical protein [Alphaproteobacteria bacterium]